MIITIISIYFVGIIGAIFIKECLSKKKKRTYAKHNTFWCF